jgi:hypothetical protein
MTHRRKRPHTDTRRLKVGKKRKLGTEAEFKQSESENRKSEPGIRQSE